MAQVGNCYYFPDQKALFLINSITHKTYNDYNNYHFDIIHRFDIVKTGYSNEKVSFNSSENLFRGRLLVDNNIPAKIVKLLKLNNLVCISIIKTAPRSVTDYNHEMAYICQSEHNFTVCYNNQCISFNDNEVVFFDGPSYIAIYFPVEYFFKIREHCSKTIKLINEIWPNKNS